MGLFYLYNGKFYRQKNRKTTRHIDPQTFYVSCIHSRIVGKFTVIGVYFCRLPCIYYISLNFNLL